LIYTTSDFIAIGMVEAFEEAHIKVGSEIRILGFDNIEGYGLVSERGEFLSSVDLPRRRIGVEAAKLLLKNLEHPKDCWDAIKVPSSLVLRKSWHPIANKSKERIEK
jgi:DNA-binding LacI/PurR family transcriptional regulator